VSRVVQLRVGGQTYRVSTSATEEELARLVAVVNGKLGGRPMTPQNMFLAAIALAHDLEEAQARADGVAQRSRDVVGRVLQRVDAALASLGSAASSAPTSEGP
jgi:cell division protein ZapA